MCIPITCSAIIGIWSIGSTVNTLRYPGKYFYSKFSLYHPPGFIDTGKEGPQRYATFAIGIAPPGNQYMGNRSLRQYPNFTCCSTFHSWVWLQVWQGAYCRFIHYRKVWPRLGKWAKGGVICHRSIVSPWTSICLKNKKSCKGEPVGDFQVLETRLRWILVSIPDADHLILNILCLD